MRTLTALSADLASGSTTSRALTEKALALIESSRSEGSRAFVRVFREAALAAAVASDCLRAAGVVPSLLAGVPVSVKDLFDIAGITTLAGSATRVDEPPATHDAIVVARLRAAGAVIVGTTNMTEFAVGGLGLNPHYGNCRNPWDRATGRIPGGSSSGAAVSVGDAMVCVALGTDTLGSVRIPAGLCGLVGFKPTAARVPRGGVFPLSTTLDSIGPLARSVACCALVDAILAGEQPLLPVPVPLWGLRLGIPKTLVMDDLQIPVAKAFERAVSALAAAGARIKEFPFPELLEITDLNCSRSIPMIECYAIHRRWLERRAHGYDPRVLSRIHTAIHMTAADYYDALQLRNEIAMRAASVTGAYDAVCMPTVPVVAPPIANFTTTDEGRIDAYPILTRNTCSANYLDRCSLSIPCHEPGTAPVGFMLMGAQMSDSRLLAIGLSVEALIGATVS